MKLIKSLFFVLAITTLFAFTDKNKWAQTPPMGWNSWDCYGPTVEEHEVKANADYMAKYLKKFGWEYIVVDIRWFVENDKAGGYNETDPRYVIDEFGRYQPAVNRFPSAKNGKGFKELADYIHSKGLKFGIHIMRGIPKIAVDRKLPVKGTKGITADHVDSKENLCQWLSDNYTVAAGKPGSQEYYNSIFELYAQWGVDFIKIDDLSAPFYHKDEIEMIRKAIDQCGRPIVLSTSPGATPIEDAEHVSKNANMWRMVNDVWDTWPHIRNLFDVCRKWYPYISPGAWPDCDMIPLGRLSIRGEVGKDRPTRLSKNEQYTLMTLFTIFRSPLFFGGDLPSNDEFTLSLLTNEEVIRMHQESSDTRLLFQQDGKVAITSKNNKTQETYLAIFNISETPDVEVKVNLADLGLTGRVKITNLWSGEKTGDFSGSFSQKIAPHASGLFKLKALVNVPPVDPQIVHDQDDMTWKDYHPIPGKNWADPSLKPGRQIRIALVAIDFPDQPFVVTLPKKSDPFGNPQIDPIPREKVAQFYADFWNTPGEVNHGQTINGYWMEQSRGQVGINKIDAFGPYRMPKNLWEYGCNEWGQANATPNGIPARGRMEKDCDSIWKKEAGDLLNNYDAILRIYAGYDETGIWQEFGEMKFRSKEDIPAEWGNPDPTKPRWIKTRYTDWTSWKAGAQQWGLSSMRQGENSGTITHEIGHYLFRTGDNNNNPYVQPYRRVGSGTWDMMDRGSFNGPEGPHSRWKVPAVAGACMPAGLMLRQKMNFKFVTENQVLMLNRNELAQSGLMVATITARAADPFPGTVAGIVVRLDGDAPQDRTPESDPALDPLSPGKSTYNFYSVEVVQQVGYDSFTPDNGVLIAKNKDKEGNTGGINGFNCFNWVIDAHPEDINKVDYLQPGSGTSVMRTPADYRQLNDALFHAGTNSGSKAEWVDTPNRLHFYILEKHTGADGIISYTVGIRSLDGSGSQARGVHLSSPESIEKMEGGQRLVFSLGNTGKGWDIYRLSVSIEGEGWSAHLANELAAVEYGKPQNVPVFVAREKNSPKDATVTLTATSESDRANTVTVRYKISDN